MPYNKLGLMVFFSAGLLAAWGKSTEIVGPSNPGVSLVPARIQVGKNAKPLASSPCETSGQREIGINCEYTASEGVSKEHEPAIVLNHVLLSFDAKHDRFSRERNLHVELTFMLWGAERFPNERPVYLEINDDAGRNYVRRILPSVDFRKLRRGAAMRFTEELLAPAFQPGRYLVQLWMPGPDPALKFDPEHSLMLSNETIPDRMTGRNTLAAVSILP
jgi:hypothetical protein